MSYVQGTKVRLDVTITDNDTGALTDPATLVCRIQDPDGNVTEQSLGSGVTRLSLGSFRAILDTAPAPKIWRYQWIANDSTETCALGQISVRSALPAPTP